MKQLFCVIAVLALFSCSTKTKLQEQREFMEQTVIEDRDLQGIPNGSYFGSANSGIVYAEVSVQVHEGKMQSVSLLEHDNLLGGPAEDLTWQVVEQQSLELDAVSGATISSKVILAAIDNALQVATGE